MLYRLAGIWIAVGGAIPFVADLAMNHTVGIHVVSFFMILLGLCLAWNPMKYRLMAIGLCFLYVIASSVVFVLALILQYLNLEIPGVRIVEGSAKTVVLGAVELGLYIVALALLLTDRKTPAK